MSIADAWRSAPTRPFGQPFRLTQVKEFAQT